MSKCRIEDLNRESEMILGIDPEHYPWFSVHRKNGRFSLVENNYGEFGMGYDPVHYDTIGAPFSYDVVKYNELKGSDYSSGFYRLNSSYRGYLALGRNGAWDICCLDAWDGCAIMVQNAESWDVAADALCRRIGYLPKEWKDLTNWLKYTPDNITTLESHQVFVFGSNLQGLHSGGAAKRALDFGAIMGRSVGIQGNSYAIPTMFDSVVKIKPYIDEFIDYAKEHPENEFLVTRIGCNNAGFREKDIAPLFSSAPGVENIVLPKSFIENMYE